MASSSEIDIWDSYKEKISDEEKKKLSDSPPFSRDHILAAPASQVFSVRISTCFETRYVYGQILVIDQYGTSYQLFSRDRDDPHLITLGHNSLPPHSPTQILNNCNWSRLIFNLIDSVDQTSIILDVIDLHKFTESDYDKVQTIRVDGFCTSAFVEYTKFFAAELAFLKVRIVRNEESVDALDKCELSGTIVAYYGNTYGVMFPGIMLFEKLSDRPYAHDLSEIPIPLLRDGVVVPAYSFLRLYVDLYDSQSHQSIQSEVDHPTSFRMSYDLSFQTTDFLITVDAQWLHPELLKKPCQCSEVVLRSEQYVPDLLEIPSRWIKAILRSELSVPDLLEIPSRWIKAILRSGLSVPYLLEKPSQCSKAILSSELFVPYLLEKPSQCTKASWRKKLPVPVPYLPEKPSKCSKSSWRSNPSLWEKHTNEVTEVFGVVICHNYDRVLKVFGKMTVYDAHCMLHALFTRHESKPEFLVEKRTSIPIEGPLERCYSGADGLSMDMNFRDVEGQLLIKHDFGWNFWTLDMPVSWYDRRLCTISAGVNGYVATFYQTFSGGVEARVNVSLTGNILSDSMPSVYGTIFGKYNNEEYSTEYEKSYYRSVLFKISQEKPKALASSLDIPLLKSLVAVPVAASLIVEVDIRVCSKDFGEISLKGEHEFDFEDDGLPMVIFGVEVDCSLKLSVAWRGYR